MEPLETNKYRISQQDGRFNGSSFGSALGPRMTKTLRLMVDNSANTWTWFFPYYPFSRRNKLLIRIRQL